VDPESYGCRGATADDADDRPGRVWSPGAGRAHDADDVDGGGSPTASPVDGGRGGSPTAAPSLDAGGPPARSAGDAGLRRSRDGAVFTAALSACLKTPPVAAAVGGPLLLCAALAAALCAAARRARAADAVAHAPLSQESDDEDVPPPRRVYKVTGLVPEGLELRPHESADAL